MFQSDFILCGVGGQGILLASEILGDVAVSAGLDVKKSEVHGMAQRGGSVVSHVRIAEKVFSPLVREGGADIIVSFERMETLRYLHYGKQGVTILMNDQRINPTAINIKQAAYPEDIEELCVNHAGSFHIVRGIETAKELGNTKVVSVVMMGGLASLLEFPDEYWLASIQRRVPKKAIELNIEAFHRGKEAVVTHPVTHGPEIHLRTDGRGQSAGIRNFDELIDRVRRLPPRRVVVAGGQNLAALEAGLDAMRRGIATPVLVGDKAQIQKMCAEHFPETDLESVEIIPMADEMSIAKSSVQLVCEGKADILLKGKVNTPVLMRAVLDRSSGLRTGRLLSDTFIFEYPAEEGTRLVMITDGGVNISPNIQQKVEIINNALEVAHALGNTLPRVALLAASETINPNVAVTMDAAVLTKMNRTGQIPDCIIEGPIALDVAISRTSAATKGTASEVAGRADIIVTASIDTANALAKSTTYFAHYRLSHVIIGAKAPILIPSRSDTADAKFLSIVLGSIMCEYYAERRAAVPV